MGKLEITYNYIHYYFAYRDSQSASLDWALQGPTSAWTQTFQILHSLSRAHAWQLAAGFSSDWRDRSSCTQPHCVSVLMQAPAQLPACPPFAAADFGPGCAPTSSRAALAGSRPKVAAWAPSYSLGVSAALTLPWWLFRINIPRDWIQAGWNGKGGKVLQKWAFSAQLQLFHSWWTLGEGLAMVLTFSLPWIEM